MMEDFMYCDNRVGAGNDLFQEDRYGKRNNEELCRREGVEINGKEREIMAKLSNK